MQNHQIIPTRSPAGKDEILNVGIIGCGQIAEHHLRFIARTAGARLAALSDPFMPNARRLAEQYGVPDVYGSHQEMLRSTSLDVVHILTPPEFHYPQAVDVIGHNTHVLLEKPCTFHAQELEDLYARAESRNLVLCPDFIQLFAPPFLEARSVIDSGQLGKVVHVEIQLSIDINVPEFRESMGLHWRYRLPGGIFHDVVTHPLYIALYWLGTPEKVAVYPHSYHLLPQGLTDHLSIMLDGAHSTAGIVISAVVKPEPYYVQVFCERGSVLVNFDTSTCLITRVNVLPRYVRRATANFAQAYRLFASGMRNIINFTRGRLIPFQGLETLIPEFYDCIRNGGRVPISRELAISVARTETEVFSQAGKLHIDRSNRPSKQHSIDRPEKILLTGATGYLGSAVTQKLVSDGFYVRALVRELSHTEPLEALGVELIRGDIRDLDSLTTASQDVDIVIHIAAALQGSRDFMLDCAIKGTKNVAAAAANCHIKRVIYISSLSVYDGVELREQEFISERSRLEEFPQLRGTYSLAKRMAEDEALSHLNDARPSWTILRPSLIVGHGRDLFSPLGKQFGNAILCPGPAGRWLSLIHVDDVAAAIIELIRNEATQGRTYNVSDEGIAQNEYIDECIRKNGYENLRVIYIPYWLARCAAAGVASLRFISRRIPNIDKRRVASLYQNSRVDSSAIKTETGWQPGRNLLETLVGEALRSTKGDPGGLPPEGMVELAAIGK